MKHTAYLLQAVLVAAWWVGLIVSEEFFAAFQFPGIGRQAFWALALPDLTLTVILSTLRAYRPWRELELIILGAFAFATLYCLSATVLTGGGWLPSSIMLLGLAYNLFLVFGDKAFRTATSDSDLVNGTKTAVQIICIWALTLFVIPAFLLNVTGEWVPPGTLRLVLAVGLFTCCSALGLWSAYVMVAQGKGTPLPVDQSQRLVVSGPYAYVRNPMAVAGIGQGLAVALATGSWVVAGYVLLGAVAWQFGVRPPEEKNLADRFGADYEDYCRRVRCWWPGFRR